MLEKLRRVARSDKSAPSTLDVDGGTQHVVSPENEAAADYMVETSEELVASIDTNDPAAWYHQGNLYRDSQKMQAALSCYYRAVEVKPEWQEVWESIAWTLVALQQLPEAHDVYYRIVEMDPHSPEGWANLGWVQNQLGQYHAALVSIDKCLHIAPQDDFAWEQRGDGLVAIGLFPDALLAYRSEERRVGKEC